MEQISYSQSGQDDFALSVCGPVGTFVDIGCNEPFYHSNTAKLEAMGWTGICIDIIPFDFSERRSRFIVADARFPIPELIQFLDALGGRADYLSVDADDANQEVLKQLIPRFRFRAVTVEHDKYRLGERRKRQMHHFLKQYRYVRQREDVCAPEVSGMPWSGQPYEDWFKGPVS